MGDAKASASAEDRCTRADDRAETGNVRLERTLLASRRRLGYVRITPFDSTDGSAVQQETADRFSNQRGNQPGISIISELPIDTLGSGGPLQIVSAIPTPRGSLDRVG